LLFSPDVQLQNEANRATLSAMRHIAVSFSFALLAIYSASSAKDAQKREIPCRTPADTASCYWTHGRLGIYNGTPSYRLWKVGTPRLLGIYSGPSVYDGPLASKYPLDNESPELPANLSRAARNAMATKRIWPDIYADFEVCPLEPEKPGVMQAACIESAKNIVAEK
jgi:hypothetical protein